MMFGSVFMLGFMLIPMLLVIGLPVTLIIILIWTLTRGGNFSARAPIHVHQSMATARTCSHRGTALQADWSHCPQCGAQV